MTLDQVMKAAFAYSDAARAYVMYDGTPDPDAASLRAAILSYGRAERERAATACAKRDTGDGTREDQEARRCASAIRALRGNE